MSALFQILVLVVAVVATLASAACPPSPPPAPATYSIQDGGPNTIYTGNEGTIGVAMRLNFAACCCVVSPIAEPYAFSVNSNNSALVADQVFTVSGAYGSFFDFHLAVRNDSIALANTYISITFSDVLKVAPGPPACPCLRPAGAAATRLIRVINNDVAAVTVTKSAYPCVIREGPASPGLAKFNITVVLTSAPNVGEDVSLVITTTTPELGFVSNPPGTVTVHFDGSNWNDKQVFTVEGKLDDPVAELNETVTISLSPASGDLPLAQRTYNNVVPSITTITCTMMDDDTAGVTFTPAGPVRVSEVGGPTAVHVTLLTMPTSVVNFTLVSRDTSEVTVPAVVSVMPADAGGKDILFVGVDDAIADGNMTTVVTINMTSADPFYNRTALLPVSYFTVITADNDQAGISVTPLSGSVVTEAGASVTMQVVLTSAPLAPVTIIPALNDSSEVRVSGGAFIVFTAANYSVPVTIVLNGVDDGIDDGDVISKFSFPGALSTDPSYSGRVPVPATYLITTSDDDTAAVQVSPMTILAFDEGSALLRTGTISVALGCEPTGPVIVSANLTYSAAYPPGWGVASQVAATPTVLSFTPGNWGVNQDITVTIVDDRIADGDAIFNVSVGRASSGDKAYNGLLPALRAVQSFQIVDDDHHALTVSVNTTTATEAGAPLAVTAVLGSMPLGPVTVTLTLVPGASTELLFTASGTNTATLVFAAAAWNTSQTVTVSAVDDLLYDGSMPVTLTASAVCAADSKYNGIAATGAPLALTAADNEAQTTVASWLPLEIGIAQSRIELTFSVPVLAIYQAAVAGAISLRSTNTSAAVPLGPFSWLSSTVVVTQPSMELEPSTTYTLALNASLTPTLVDSYVFSEEFFVIELVVSTSPSNGESSVALNRGVETFFDQRMNIASMNGRFHIWRSDGNHSDFATALPGVMTLLGNGRVLRFQPSVNFEDSIEYVARFEVGIATSGADGLTVITLPVPIETRFTAIPVPPNVMSVVPSANAEGIAIRASLSVRFDEVMNAAATAGAIAVWHGDASAALGTAIAGNVTWNPSHTNFTFVPLAPLPDDTLIFWTVTTAATDVPGNALANPTVYQFGTVDLSAPHLSVSNPLPGEHAIAVSATLSVTFSEAMRPTAVASLSRVACAGATLPSPIAVAVAESWNAAGTTATLVPSATLSPDCEYRISLSSALADVSGNPVVHAEIAFVTACSETMHAADLANPLSDCVCNAALFGPAHGPCADCPEFATCDGGLAGPRANEGYFGVGSNVFVACTPSESCRGNNSCAAGYMGTACSDCAANYYRLSSRCAACPANQWLRWGALTIFVAVAAAAFLIGAVVLMRRVVARGIANHRRSLSSRLAVVSIAINFFQILSVMSQFKLGWPRRVLELFDTFTILNFNTDLLASECSKKLSFQTKFGILLLLPIILIAFYCLLALAMYAFARSPCMRDRGMFYLTRKNVMCAVMALMSFVYMMLAKTALQPFDCTQRSDGRWLLDADPSLFCFDPWWWSVLPQAIAAVVVYVLGIPLFMLGIVLRYRSSMEDVNSVGFAIFGVISSRFRPGHAWYELIIIFRKAAVLFAQMFVANSPPIQAMIAQCALLVALAVHQKYGPYNHRSLNSVESALLLAGLVILLFGQVFYSTQSAFLAALTILIVALACCALALVVMHAFCVSGRSSSEVAAEGDAKTLDASEFSSMSRVTSVAGSAATSSEPVSEIEMTPVSGALAPTAAAGGSTGSRAASGSRATRGAVGTASSGSAAAAAASRSGLTHGGSGSGAEFAEFANDSAAGSSAVSVSSMPVRASTAGSATREAAHLQ